MASPDNTLFVKHLPALLTVEEKKELLCHFGAEHVKCMTDSGRMKYTAFATFPDNDAATFALKRLHQLEILGCKLSVEFSKPNFQSLHPAVLDTVPKELPETADEINEKKDSVKKVPPPLPETVNSLSSKACVNYPLNPKLKFLYPPPTVSILTNIANALAAVPKFYVQVLHLMNKMNLPAPFGVLTATPPVAPEPPVHTNQGNDILGEDIVEEEEMVMSSTEESELESDTDQTSVKPILPLKRQKKHTGRKAKRLKLQKITETPKSATSSQIKAEDVFEPIDGQGNKKINFKLQSGISKSFVSRSKDPGTLQDAGLPHVDLLDVLESMPTVGGFGKIEPMNLAEKEKGIPSDESESEELSEYISSRELRRNLLSEREMKEFNVFRNYDPGEPSSRLYIKNLHRHVTEKELKYIFGRYVDWANQLEVNMFDVRLMTEGRMKGQAFVTLGSDKIAARALKRTNGYLLRDKPMVVNFARSAKVKDSAEKDGPKTPEDGLSRHSEKRPSGSGRKSSSFESNTRNDQRHSNTLVPSSKTFNEEHSRNKSENGRHSESDHTRTEKYYSRELPNSVSSDAENLLADRRELRVQSVSKKTDNPEHAYNDKKPISNVSAGGSGNVETLLHSLSSDSIKKERLPDPAVTGNLSAHSQFEDNSKTPPHLSESSATPPRMEESCPTPPRDTDIKDKSIPVPSVEDVRFVTNEMLETNRLTESEKSENRVFKNYKTGEPSCKLYVKNLNHKLVTEDDMVYIFGKFVQGCSDVLSGLDIKLLEGRMKGQAFITFQTVEEAGKALESVNGYRLYDKPMVVHFGKSG